MTILIVLDEPRGSIFHGGDVAAPVFRRIAEPVLDYLGVPPDGPAKGGGDLASLGAGREPPSPGGGGPAGDPAAVERASLVTRRPAGPRGPSPASPPVLEIHPVAPRPLALLERSDGGPEAAVEAARAKGPDPVAVPDLAGAPLRDAVVVLAREGLAASVRGDGFVVAQDPPAGAAAWPGSRVALTLGRLVEERPMPDPARGGGRPADER